ncbi:MAG: hypothetical protein IKA12_05215 [Clostridia bacterium]|nr:hypothetical protein [Clostridia bacterium]
MKQYVKPITVMLSIILLCGGLLAILSDLLFVTQEERINRAINKIYSGEDVKLEQTIDLSTVDMTEFNDLGVIKACYKLSNDDYLVLSTGKKGYSNGTVTTYVAIDINLKVRNVVEDSYTGQTLMAKLSGLYQSFIGKSATQSQEDISEIVTGATKSANAASNSVYVALQLVSLVIGG